MRRRVYWTDGGLTRDNLLRLPDSPPGRSLRYVGNGGDETRLRAWHGSRRWRSPSRGAPEGRPTRPPRTSPGCLKTFPEALAGVRWRSLAPKLVAWVRPGGQRVAYLFTPDEACTEVELTRGRGSGNDEEPGPDFSSAGCAGTIEKGAGGFSRELSEMRLGHLLLEPCGGETEASADGNTSRKDRAAPGVRRPATFRGVLSSVTGTSRAGGRCRRSHHRVLRRPLGRADLPDGGRRQCDSCRTVGVSAFPRFARGPLFRRGTAVSAIGTFGRPVCHEPCPPASHPDIARVPAIAARSHPWRRNDDRGRLPASLYRSRGRCLREHPSAATATTMAAVNATPPEPARVETYPAGVVLLGVNGFEAPPFARHSDPRLLSGTYLLDFEVPVARGKRGAVPDEGLARARAEGLPLHDAGRGRPARGRAQRAETD